MKPPSPYQENAPPAKYQVWIVRSEDWHPSRWYDVPPQAVAVQLAQQEPLSEEHAAHYLQVYNTHKLQLAEPDLFWAVAVPVEVAYLGQPEPHQVLTCKLLKEFGPEDPGSSSTRAERV